MEYPEVSTGLLLKSLHEHLQQLPAPGSQTADSKSDVSVLKKLEIRLAQLNDEGRAEAIIADVPVPPCRFAKPFLDNNIDYFLALFLIAPPQKQCENLLRHLNNCFFCARIFAEFLQDYSSEHQQEKVT